MGMNIVTAAPASSWTLISDTTLAAHGNFDFTSLPSYPIYKVFFTGGSTNGSGLLVRLNNDSSNAYISENVYGVNAGVSAATATGTSANIGFTSNAANELGSNYEMTFFNPDATSKKGGIGHGGNTTRSSQCAFNNANITAAITRITIFSDGVSGDFLAGTRCIIYGVKGN